MKTTPAARAFLIFTAALIGTVVLAMVLLFSTKENTEKTIVKTKENADVLKGQEAILRVLLAVTGCTAEDTTEQCKARTSGGASRVVLELDCRIRLAIAAEPAPAAGRSCVPPTPTTTTTTVPPPVVVVPPG